MVIFKGVLQLCVCCFVKWHMNYDVCHTTNVWYHYASDLISFWHLACPVCQLMIVWLLHLASVLTLTIVTFSELSSMVTATSIIKSNDVLTHLLWKVLPLISYSQYIVLKSILFIYMCCLEVNIIHLHVFIMSISSMAENST